MVARSHHHQRHSIKWEACRHAGFDQTLVLTTNNTLLGAVGPTKPGSSTHRVGNLETGDLLASCYCLFFLYKNKINPFFKLKSRDFELFDVCDFEHLCDFELFVSEASPGKCADHPR